MLAACLLYLTCLLPLHLPPSITTCLSSLTLHTHTPHYHAHVHTHACLCRETVGGQGRHGLHLPLSQQGEREERREEFEKEEEERKEGERGGEGDTIHPPSSSCPLPAFYTFPFLPPPSMPACFVLKVGRHYWVCCWGREATWNWSGDSDILEHPSGYMVGVETLPSPPPHTSQLPIQLGGV